MTNTFKYPPSAANGKLLLSSDANREAIFSAIQTKNGERVYRAGYGNDLDELRTIPDLSEVILRLEDDVNDSLGDYQPLAISINGSPSEDGQIDLYLLYEDDQESNTLEIRF